MNRIRTLLIALAIQVLFLQSVAQAEEVNVLREFGRINTTEVGDIYPYLGIINAETGEWVEQNYDFYTDRITTASEEICTEDYWLAEHILCDEGSTRNSKTAITRGHESVGTTFEVYDTDSPFSYKAFQIVDLQGDVNIGALQIYQMFSDGKVTHVEMLKHNSTGDEWPTYADAGWSQVVERTAVGEGNFVETDGLEDGSVVVDPTTISFTSTNARYVMFVFYNDGSHGDRWWIEVGGVKLFGSLGKDTTFWRSVENCRLDFANAATAGASLSVSTYQSCFFTGVNSSNLASVNAQLQALMSSAAKAGTPMSHNDVIRAAGVIADRLDLLQRLATGKLVYAAEFEPLGLKISTKTLDALAGQPADQIDTWEEVVALAARL